MNPRERNVGFYGSGTPQLMINFHDKYPVAAYVYPDTSGKIPSRYQVSAPEGESFEWCAVAYGYSAGKPCIIMDARRPEDWGEPDDIDNCGDPEIHRLLSTSLGPYRNQILIRGVVETAQMVDLEGFQRVN